jgi:hypothetical protein
MLKECLFSHLGIEGKILERRTLKECLFFRLGIEGKIFVHFDFPLSFTSLINYFLPLCC